MGTKTFREIYIDETKGFSDMKGFEGALGLGEEHPIEELERVSDTHLERFTVCTVGETLIVCRHDVLVTLYRSEGELGDIPLDANGRHYSDPNADKASIIAEMRIQSDEWIRDKAKKLLKKKLGGAS